MNQIKNTFLKKKSERFTERRTYLMNPIEVKSVLIISNTENTGLKRKIEELFEAASVYHLFERDIKEDRTVGFYYSVHHSDFNLTGNLKNDKLKNLERLDVDLLLDLSSGSEQLNYFVSRMRSALKVGDITSHKAYLYDLMIEFKPNEIQNVENIYNQMMIFTQHAYQQV